LGPIVKKLQQQIQAKKAKRQVNKLRKRVQRAIRKLLKNKIKKFNGKRKRALKQLDKLAAKGVSQ